MNYSIIAKSKLPIDFINEINADFSKRNAEKILTGMCENRLTTFRINYLKSNEVEVENELNESKIAFEKMKICALVAYVILEKDENDLSKLKIYEDGKIYVQSISSMIPPIVLSPKPGDKVLDLASAPRKQNNRNGCNDAKWWHYFCKRSR